jgi:microcystin-dependent protein
MTVTVGEIRMMAGPNIVPPYCVPCDGTSLPAANYQDLYNAIGEAYGTTGTGMFNLPDLRGCLPISRSTNYPLGNTGGSESVTLTTAQIPAHTHPMYGTSTTATQTTPSLTNILGQSGSRPVIYQSSVPGPQQMSSQAIGYTGDNSSHNNVQPFLCVNFVIAALALIGPPPPYLGEIRVFPFNFMPMGWLPCVGTTLKISQNTALFHLLGTMYGGDGQTTFNLPDLRGAVPMGSGDGPGRTPRSPGATGGAATVTLLQNGLPTHLHSLASLGMAANATSPQANTFAQAVGATPYIAPVGTLTSINDSGIGSAGGGGPHNNLQPFLAMNFGIAVTGSYPPVA